MVSRVMALRALQRLQSRWEIGVNAPRVGRPCRNVMALGNSSCPPSRQRSARRRHAIGQETLATQRPMAVSKLNARPVR